MENVQQPSRDLMGCFLTAQEAYAARQAYIEAHPELGFTTKHGL